MQRSTTGFRIAPAYRELHLNLAADLVVINGNPAASIGDIGKVQTVFKQGVGYDPVKLIRVRRTTT